MKKVNYFGKKSIASFLSYVINFLWYLQLVIISLILIKSVFNGFTSDNSFSWPVSYVSLIQEDITSKNPKISVTGIKTTDGTLIFDAKNNWLANGIMFLGILLLASPFLIVTFQVRKILKSFVLNDPFLKSNLPRIRFIGILLIVYPVLVYIFGIFYTHYLNFNFEGYEFINRADLTPLFFGVLILIISEVFRQGIEYREENDLTI